MSMPLVSIVMPAYNAERYLREALESAFRQDYEPFEVIVVDDGSTDATAGICASFTDLRYVRQEHAGPSAGRNRGVAAARGELIAFFDSDDVLPPRRLRVQAAHLAEHPEVACVYGRQEWIDPPPWLTRDPVYGELDGIPLVSAMIRRAIFDEVGGFDESFVHGEDTDFLIRMRERGVSHAIVDDVVLYRRFHGGNLTGKPPAQSPLLRSLRAKLERARIPSTDGGTR